MFSLATADPAAASASSATVVATPSDISVSWSLSQGDGSSSDPFLYVVTVDDCSKRVPANTARGARTVDLNGATRTSDRGKWFTVQVTCTSGSALIFFPENLLAAPATNKADSNTVTPQAPVSSASATFELRPAAFVGTMGFEVGFLFEMDDLVLGISASALASSGGTSAPSPDPTASAVATAVAQSAAAGVEGTSSAVMVRDGQIVPVTSTLSSDAGPRGVVLLETEGLKVTVASPVGARAGSGVVVPSGGEMECSLCGAFAPGSVVEAWVNSDPRLTAAVLIPEDAEDGDCHLLAIPTGAPLDGGGAIEEGAHTLQLRMYTDSGFTVLSTGITIGSVSPTRIPAGEGSVPRGGMLVLLLGAAGLGLAAVRRQVVTG